MEQKLVELITQMQGMAPAATAQSIHAVWLQGVINILTCLLGFGIAAALGQITRKLYAAHQGAKSKGDITLPGISAGVCGFVATLLLIAAVFGLLSTSAWVAVIDPQSALALKIIDKVGK